ncbi:uncharacterized protein ACWYII_045447 [Salvelinus alpinus]
MSRVCWFLPPLTAELLMQSKTRITQQSTTKQHDQRQQEQRKEKWTWEEILDGKGPWAQPGEYRRPKAELEAAKAERRWYEEAARRRGWEPESQTQKFLGGGHTRSVAKPGRIPEPTPRAYRGVRERRTGQTPCYAVKRTVSPVRVLSPVRAIPPCRTGRARLGIEPDVMKPAQRIWSPVRLLGPAYMAPALRMVSPVRQHSPVRAIPPRRTGRATGTIQPGKVGQARCSRARVLLHGPVYPVPPPSTSPPVAAPRTRLSLRVLSPAAPTCPALSELSSSPAQPVPIPRTRPTVRLSRAESAVCPTPSALPVCPAPSEPSVCPAPSEPSVCPALSEPVCPALSEPVCPAAPELPVCPAAPELPVCPAAPELPVCPAAPELPLSVCHSAASVVWGMRSVTEHGLLCVSIKAHRVSPMETEERWDGTVRSVGHQSDG